MSAGLAFLLQMGGMSLAQTPDAMRAQQSQTTEGIHVLPVQGNVYMIAGEGGNIALQIGKDGVVLVDTGLAEASNRVIAAIRSVTPGPIRFIINTHVHPD